MAASEFKACFLVIERKRVKSYGDELYAKMFFVAIGTVLICDGSVIPCVCRNAILNGYMAIEATVVIRTSLPKYMTGRTVGDTFKICMRTG